MISSSWSEG